MKRAFLAGFVLAFLLFPASVAAGLVNVHNPMTQDLAGAGYSIQNVNVVTANQVEFPAGAAGVDWLNGSGVMATRIIAGTFVTPLTITAPASTLLIDRLPDGTAQLWFQTAPGSWSCIAGCAP